MPPLHITPSILSADFRALERELKDAEAAGADRIHCDVMDGVFVPNITFGPFIVEAVKKCVSIPLDVHLMITEPIRYVESFCNAGSDTLTVHAEACTDLGATLGAIGRCKVRRGVTVNPDKPVALFTEYGDCIDQVLIMTVYAGFGGQKFIHEMLPRIRSVYDWGKSLGRELDIQVDGGVDQVTAPLCAAQGANVLVAGSYIFGSNDYSGRIAALRQAGNALVV